MPIISSAASAWSDFRAREQAEECFAVADSAQRAHEDILERPKITHQSQLLRDVADQSTEPALAEAADRLDRIPRPGRGWFQNARQNSQQGRFAGARWAHDDGVLTRGNG